MLLLDTFAFQDFEIPEQLKGLLSGKQLLAVKKQIGGQRVIDAMGPDPADIAWSGRFQFKDAVTRADQLASMRDAGQPVTLVCDLVVLTVLVAEFNFDYERPYQALYDIKLIVLPDDENVTMAPTIDDAVASDLGSATATLSAAPSVSPAQNLASGIAPL
jgi:hypothetical protein